MNHIRRIVVLMLFFASLAPAFADTIAVAVRHHSEAERAPALANLVEEGAMEYLFANGNIIFDLEIDPTDEVFDYRAIDAAERGGAAYVIVLELAFTTVGERGLYPAEIEVRLLEIDGESERVRATVFADDLQGETDLTSETMADRLGARASAIALEEIAGGTAAW